MATSKHVTICLIAALTGVAALGQDQPTSSSQRAPRGPSNTREASGLVRITVDPAILPLDLQTINSLVNSSSVLLKAAGDVLSLSTPEDFDRFKEPPVMVRWLSASSGSVSPQGQWGRLQEQEQRRRDEDEMRRQLEHAYGPGAARQMGVVPPEPGGGQESGQGESSQTGGVSSQDGPEQKQSTELHRLPGESDVAYRARLNQIRAQQKALQETKTRGMEGMGGMGMMPGRGRRPGPSVIEAMGGMGSYGGGMMGGMGMGGGMMGGYGSMGGMGGFGYASMPDSAGIGGEQSAVIELQVHLPDTVPARAQEFLQAVVGNLRQSLLLAHDSYLTDVDNMLAYAKHEREFLESRVDSPTGAIAPATLRIKKQLDTLVDLSGLTTQTPLQAAVEMLKKAVEPPLNIVVLWRDLDEYLHIDASSPVNIDGLPSVKLGTMLDLLVKGLPSGDSKPMWKIRDEVIVIGTAATLGQTQEPAGGPRVETDVRNLGGQRSELARKAQALELDLAGLNARQKAIQEQIATTETMARKQLAEDRVTRELENLEHTSAINLENLKKLADVGRVTASDLAQAQESMARVRIDLARRQEELTRQAGGGQLEEFTKELSHLAVDKAEKEAQLQIVLKQLDEVQKQLMRALTFDPEATRLRLAQETLDTAGRRVVELQTRLTNLQAPVVTMIGAN
jgi:hypothetical protein